MTLGLPCLAGADLCFKHVRPVVSRSILLTLLQLCKVLLTSFVNFFYVSQVFSMNVLLVSKSEYDLLPLKKRTILDET